MNFTTIEQSQALIEAGLNPDTADMCWIKDNGLSENKYPQAIPWKDNMAKEFYAPCWSTGALIELLPREIWLSKKDYSLHYWIKIHIYEVNNRALYQIAYGNSCNRKTEWCDKFSSSKNENFIDALIEMIFWLLKNGFIKKV